MAGRKKEPIDLLLAKGKKHLTKEEIEKRRNEEIKVDLLDISVPTGLTKRQENEFIDIAKKLQHVKIMTELDEEALARYIITNSQYKKIAKKLQLAINKKEMNCDEINKYQSIHDKLLKQVRLLASDLGLTVTSRSRLILPPSKDPPKDNKFSKFGINQNEQKR